MIEIFTPQDYQQFPEAASILKRGKALLLDVYELHPDVAQRFVDAIAGAAFALNCHQTRINQGTFLFAPFSVRRVRYSEDGGTN